MMHLIQCEHAVGYKVFKQTNIKQCNKGILCIYLSVVVLLMRFKGVCGSITECSVQEDAKRTEGTGRQGVHL